MIVEFTVPGRLPGLNEIVGQARYNRFAGASQKKKETRRCSFFMLRIPSISSPVTIHFDWYEPNNRRDPDNIRAGSKFILDAMVEMGKLPGDGKKWIKGISDTFHPADPDNPRVEVKILGA